MQNTHEMRAVIMEMLAAINWRTGMNIDGKPKSCTECPVANYTKAILDIAKFEYTDVLVSPTYINVYSDITLLINVPLPQGATEFIHRFDRGEVAKNHFEQRSYVLSEV